MNKKYYEILGLNGDAVLNDLEKNYKMLEAKFRSQLFEEGEVGMAAAEMLTELKNAYDIVYEDILGKGFNDEKSNSMELIYDAIRKKDADTAQNYLDKVLNKNAVYHYLQSVVFYLKEWYDEAVAHLQLAIEMQPAEAKYTMAMTKLVAKAARIREREMTDEERMDMLINEIAKRNNDDNGRR